MKKRTFNKMQWGVRAYNSWHENRLSDPSKYDVNVFESNLSNVKELKKESLCKALCRFIPEVTKVKDGQDYLGKTLYEMVVSIQKYLNQNDLPWKLLEDPVFINVKTVLDNVMKERAQSNIGLVRKQAEVISFEHENEMGEKGVLGEDTPDKL